MNNQPTTTGVTDIFGDREEDLIQFVPRRRIALPAQWIEKIFFVVLVYVLFCFCVYTLRQVDSFRFRKNILNNLPLHLCC
jgi:uncharacterized membrane protein SirB2